MSLVARQHSPIPFDPFLFEMEGAEVVRDLADIRRAVESMVGREVMVATDDGEVVTARCVEALGLRIHGHLPLAVGQMVAVTDHHDLHFVGFRATIGAIVGPTDGDPSTRTLRLFVPREAAFYPGRRHVRIDGTLGAEIVLETADQLTVARTVDVSMGGVGVQTDARDGISVGQILTVHLQFSDLTLSLPARVRTAVVCGEDVRLGLEFAARNDAFERRVASALASLANGSGVAKDQ